MAKLDFDRMTEGRRKAPDLVVPAQVDAAKARLDIASAQIGVLKAGTYRILALSHFQPRDKRDTIDGSLKGILDNFFDRSEQLLGKCRYHLGELKYSGKETELWDHSFERE